MKSDVLILGKGYIGERIQERFGYPIASERITCFKDAEAVIKTHSPKVIINAIGSIGRNVDACELDKDKTLLAHSFVPIILAEVAIRNNIKLVHISSGCIFHFDYKRDKPLEETVQPDFLELFYSRSKIYSELPLERLSLRYPILILRIRVPLDNRNHPKNLLNKLIAFKDTIADLPNSVSYIPDFLSALDHLLKQDCRGVYNVVNRGALRYAELLDVYKKYVPDFTYQEVDFKKLNIIRTNLILATSKLEKTGFRTRDIHDVLEECVCGYLGKSCK
ncbi:MAG: sugar nucleotide-binding protein [Candidatus Omnitrophica bacterium]|nr:sugar nucleotide-binding protein [Candidatus Omnitrophota bacterium]